MKRYPLNLKLISILGVTAAALLISPLSIALGVSTSSPLDIKIKLEKESFAENEPIAGEVIIYNDLPATFPVTFTLKLYHNDEFFRQTLTNTPVFSGKNELELKNFGITDINGPASVGHWRVIIVTGGNPPVEASAEFTVPGEAPIITAKHKDISISRQTHQTSFPRNFVSDYEPLNTDHTVNMVVEIPAGTNEKWEVIKPEGKLELEMKKGKPRIIEYLGYPGNYGMIPQTLLPKELGGDGDPLDIISIGRPLVRGTVAKAKIIGVLKFLDKGEQDDKLLAVLPDTALYGVKDIQQLNETFPGISLIIKTWFLYYKGSGKMVFQGFGSPEEAVEILKTAMEHYQTRTQPK